MKLKTLWLISLLGGWVGFVGLAIAKTQAYQAQSSGLQSQASSPLATSPLVTPPSLAGLDLTHWPQHCRQLRRDLNRATLKTRRGQNLFPNQVTYSARPVQPFTAPAWKLRWQGSTFAIPAVDYQQLTVVRQASGAITVILQANLQAHLQTDLQTGLQAETRAMDARATVGQIQPVTQPVRVILTQQTLPSSIPQVRDAIASLEGVELIPLKGRRRLQTEQLLAKQLFGGSATQEELVELAYQHQPDHLSCQMDQWQQDLPIAMALEFKQEQFGDVVAVYPQVGQTKGRVIRHRMAGPDSTSAQTAWQAQLTNNTVESELWVSLPEQHVSASVGLGFGQDNWWEADGRPPWLDALEAAIALPLANTSNATNATNATTPKDAKTWQQLALALENSNFSKDSVKSVRYIAAELSHDVHPAPQSDP